MRDSSLSWQKKLTFGFNHAVDLLKFLELPVEQGSPLAEKQFASRVPLGFAQRMHKGNPNDPLLLQVLAVDEELNDVSGYVEDPLDELNKNPVKGILHKYKGRVLLTLTGACAINCRYCFRRHFPYNQNNPGRSGWEEACEYIAGDPSIVEVILSGGDPLLASDNVLKELLQRLDAISHVNTVRIHSRIPIVLPERIDNHFKSVLQATRLNKVIVLHCNHTQELDSHVKKVCDDLNALGCYLLNQSVLLKGINDSAEQLALLSHGLFSFGVLPYYLHRLDKVKGAAHFDLPLRAVHAIYRKLQALVPGYLLPRLACEEPGKASKTLLY